MVTTISPEVLEAFPDPLVVVSRCGRVLAVNGPAEEMLQLPPGEAPEVTLREIASLSAAELDNLLHLCLATTAPVPLRLFLSPAGGATLTARGEGWRCNLDGEPAVMIRLHRDSDGLSPFTDLTRLVDELNKECLARRAMEGRLRSALAELHELNSLRDQVMSQVSHDLRTPLNAILGMTEFMRMKPFGPLAGKYEEYIDGIHASGESLLSLVNQVLHLSAEDKAEQEMTVEALVDLRECLESCLKVVEPLAKNRHLQIMVPADIALPKLRADHSLVTQILTHLLGSAAKFSREGGRIEISVDWRQGEALVIEVKGDGAGGSEEQLVSINDGFVARNVYTTGDNHIGYSLAFSRHSAKAIGGRLDIRSLPDGGTVAALKLPADLLGPDRAR